MGHLVFFLLTVFFFATGFVVVFVGDFFAGTVFFGLLTGFFAFAETAFKALVLEAIGFLALVSFFVAGAFLTALGLDVGFFTVDFFVVFDLAVVVFFAAGLRTARFFFTGFSSITSSVLAKVLRHSSCKDGTPAPFNFSQRMLHSRSYTKRKSINAWL